MDKTKPLIIQSDATLLLDTHDAQFENAREAISCFAELEKSPEHFHHYKMSDLSIWNAAAVGLSLEQIEESLNLYSRYAPPSAVLAHIKATYERYGRLELQLNEENPKFLTLSCFDNALLFREMSSYPKLKKLLEIDDSKPNCFLVNALDRGLLKNELIKLGWPVKDLAPLAEGSALHLEPHPELAVRDYQQSAMNAFIGGYRPGSGFGVIVLPCGAGKTIVGIATMLELQCETLILAANIAAARQWMREILDKTSLDSNLIGEYSGETKQVRPVTVATYQILIWRKNKEAEFEHFHIFNDRKWGLIIYDEAHLLPAPVFRITSEIQSVRRLGLTATLVREDGAEGDVFSLIGPKRYDVPWKELEGQGWIAHAYCIEVKVELDESEQVNYAVASPRAKTRLSGEAKGKVTLAQRLIMRHEGQSILVIGQYLSQLKTLAEALNAPLITGKMANGQREELYNKFRRKEVLVLVVSKVANFSIDLPDASVAIQVSGSFGSRQEEAQRLGRILRPKDHSSYFYTLVAKHTQEELFASHRQKFLTEQGYTYMMQNEADYE